MAKIDKSQYTKAEWKVLKEQRRQEKRLKLLENTIDIDNVSAQDTAFVIGNGKSRLPVNLEQIKTKGKVYACNAVYRTFQPDHLIAVDVKMVLEINKAEVEKYKSGKPQLFGFFVGQVMKETNGRANPEVVNKILKEEIDK